jgi:hypothetical protein
MHCGKSYLTRLFKSYLTPFFLALALAGCAARPPSGDAFVFGVMGDTPYNDREETHFVKMLQRMDGEPLAFIVHVGDIKAGGNSPCTDALFAKRRAQLDRSKHAIVYTPGDNEWTDCRRKSNGAMDPLERLARLREMFFADRWSLGTNRIETQVQDDRAAPCGSYPENRAWTRGRIRFVTLNIPGSDNNVGFDKASDDEAACRNEANRRWLERAVGESMDSGTRALVVAIQANPWDTKKPVFKAFLAQLERAARRLGKPLLFVHGDTHTYRVDAPFADAGGPIMNLTRLETYGSPFVGWVKVTVDPERPDVFTFEPKTQAFVPPAL